MKKILLVLAVAGVLVSCSSQNETVKKEATKTTVATPQVETSQQTVVPEEVTQGTEDTQDTVKAQEEPALGAEDSKAVKPKASNHVARGHRNIKRKATSPTNVEPKVEEKADESTPLVTTETSVDKAVDNDVDKKIAEIEIDSKKVEPKPVEEKKSNKSLYGVIAAIVIAAGAVVAFKKK